MNSKEALDELNSGASPAVLCMRLIASLGAAEKTLGDGGLREQKDAAYAERDKLVSALSKVFPSHLCRHPISDETWENDWRWIVCIHVPTGQMTWHIHDSELPQFSHLGQSENHWDGHDTAEKYRRLAALARPALTQESKAMEAAMNRDSSDGPVADSDEGYKVGHDPDACACHDCTKVREGGCSDLDCEEPDCVRDRAMADADRRREERIDDEVESKR